MNVWPLSRSRSRIATRGMSAFVALMLVASNALATMGLCIVKAPPAAVPVVALTDAGDAPCPGHSVAQSSDTTAQPLPAVAAHCTQDDPGAQARTGELPPAAIDAVPAFQRVVASLAAASIAIDRHDDPPPAPLYARLSRLLL